jgi:hypothetical protein
MNNIQYKHLFTPIKLGNTLFRNRIFASPTGCLGVDDFGAPTMEGIAFYERKAAGGAAAVTIGDCIVDLPNGHVTAYQMLMDSKRGFRLLPAWRTPLHGTERLLQLNSSTAEYILTFPMKKASSSSVLWTWTFQMSTRSTMMAIRSEFRRTGCAISGP